MFPLTLKYDEVAETEIAKVCYIVVCQYIEKMRWSSV